MAMLVKPDPENALLPMLWSWLPLAKVMLVKAEHPLKVLLAMLARDAGMTTFPATTSAHPKPAPMETSCKSSMLRNPRRSVDGPPSARLLWGTHGALAAHEPVIERALGTEGAACLGVEKICLVETSSFSSTTSFSSRSHRFSSISSCCPDCASCVRTTFCALISTSKRINLVPELVIMRTIISLRTSETSVISVTSCAT